MPWVFLLLSLAFSAPAAAAPPELSLAASARQFDLGAGMAVAVVTDTSVADPQVLWDAPPAADRLDGQGRWRIQPGDRTVGRATLRGGPVPETRFIVVPVSRVDTVQVWSREGGGAWRSAEAGDRVPLSRWPVAGQFPAIPVLLGTQPVDVVVAISNDGAMRLPVLLKTHARFAEDAVLQANLLGVVLGLGLMGAIVCLISALTFRNRANWVVFVYASWTFVMVAGLSGYGALWFTPEWPAFNDAFKHFTGVVMAALLLAATIETLDRLERWPALRRAGLVAIGLSVAYGLVQGVVLPASWRPAGGVLWAAACILLSGLLCVLSVLRGGAHVGWVAAAVGSFALLAVLAAVISLGHAGGDATLQLDVRSILTALLLLSSAQMLRHALFRRERYGRDVLARARFSRQRDPLTGLLSFAGVQQAYESAALRQLAGRGKLAMLVLTLPRLEESTAEHGFVVTERALVRLAATLHRALGGGWEIGRLGKDRFVALSTTACTREAELGQLATRVLSQCARLEEPLSPVTDFGLHIACTFRGGETGSFRDLVRELDDAAGRLADGKRIALVVQPAAAGI